MSLACLRALISRFADLLSATFLLSFRIGLAVRTGLLLVGMVLLAPMTAAWGADASTAQPPAQAVLTLPVEGELPSLAGATAWLNSPPLTRESLKGKVVLVDFWTYSCINCLRTLPYVNAWYDKYKDHGLVILGVHTPEFDFEKDKNNVAMALGKLGIHYPIAMDNDYAIWQGFDNRYWPAHYFIDAQGRIREHQFGEGGYRASEDVIRALLTEAGYRDLPSGYVSPTGKGAQAADSGDPGRSPETYVGYGRMAGCVQVVSYDRASDYVLPTDLDANDWGFGGSWTVHEQSAEAASADASISYRFHGRDLHLVMGPGADGKPVRFRVTLDGKAPGADHGVDTDAEGNGVVTEQRLYQLVRQAQDGKAREFTITFYREGVAVYAFTFG